MNRDHPVLVWVWRSGQGEVDGQTGYVECMMSVAVKLIAKGVAQSTRIDARQFIEIDDPVEIKKLGLSTQPKPIKPDTPEARPKEAELVKAKADLKGKAALTVEQALELEKKLKSDDGKLHWVAKK